MSGDQRAEYVYTQLCCPLCEWRSAEVRDLYRTGLTPDYQKHFMHQHMPRPKISQRVSEAAARPVTPAEDRVTDLMDALTRSVEQAREARDAKR